MGGPSNRKAPASPSAAGRGVVTAPRAGSKRKGRSAVETAVTDDVQAGGDGLTVGDARRRYTISVESTPPFELFALVAGYGAIAGKVYGVRENEGDARRDLTGSKDYVVRYVRKL